MEWLRWQNVLAKSLIRISGAENNTSDLEKWEQEEMMEKKRPLTWYYRLINYFYEKIKKLDIVKDKFMSFLEIDKDYSKKLRQKNRVNN